MDFRDTINEVVRLIKTGEECGFKVSKVQDIKKSYEEITLDYKRFLQMFFCIDDYIDLLESTLEKQSTDEKSFSLFIYISMLVKDFYPSIEALKNTPEIKFIPMDEDE